MPTWVIEVVEYAGGRVVKQITCDHGERQADRIERGLNINLNHDRFYTRVIPPAPAPKAQTAS